MKLFKHAITADAIASAAALNEQAKGYMNAALLFGQFNPVLGAEYAAQAMKLQATTTTTRESHHA